MGMDLDLNKALQEAAQETVAFLRDQKGMSTTEAYALSSVGIDFRIAEAVDAVQMVYGMIPKRIFQQNPDYWAKR
jgi:acetamidase/formamidase